MVLLPDLYILVICYDYVALIPLYAKEIADESKSKQLSIGLEPYQSGHKQSNI